MLGLLCKTLFWKLFWKRSSLRRFADAVTFAKDGAVVEVCLVARFLLFFLYIYPLFARATLGGLRAAAPQHLHGRLPLVPARLAAPLSRAADRWCPRADRWCPRARERMREEVIGGRRGVGVRQRSTCCRWSTSVRRSFSAEARVQTAARPPPPSPPAPSLPRSVGRAGKAAPERSSGKRQVGTPGYCGGGGREGGTRWKVWMGKWRKEKAVWKEKLRLRRDSNPEPLNPFNPLEVQCAIHCATEPPVGFLAHRLWSLRAAARAAAREERRGWMRPASGALCSAR